MKTTFTFIYGARLLSFRAALLLTLAALLFAPSASSASSPPSKPLSALVLEVPRPGLPIEAFAAATPTPASPPAIRERLRSRGIEFSLTYRADVFTALQRGAVVDPHPRYLGSFDTTFTFDFARMNLHRGKFVLAAQSLHGRGINDAGIGAVQAPGNLDNPGFNKVTEAYYTDSYFSGRATLKIGRQYGDADFNATESGAEFLNSSYGLNPTIPLPTFPAPAFGITFWLEPRPWISIGAGVFKGDILEPLSQSHPPTVRAPLAVFEAKLRPYRPASSFHGVYSVGLWQQRRGAWSSSPGPQHGPIRNYGFYATTEHWFQRQSSSGENPGPSIFTQLGLAPADRNQVFSFVAGGVRWPGLFSSRPSDSVGIAFTQVGLSSGKRESIAELFYRSSLDRRIWVQPDVQLIHHASGNQTVAFAIGTRLGVTF